MLVKCSHEAHSPDLFMPRWVCHLIRLGGAGRGPGVLLAFPRDQTDASPRANVALLASKFLRKDGRLSTSTLPFDDRVGFSSLCGTWVDQ